MTMFKALVNAQKEFAPALKTSNNPHFRSKYAALDAVIEAVIDALNNHGFYLQQKTHECDGGVKVETILIHESGESLSSGTLFVPAVKHDAQGYGSALTYARRYSLMAACGIAPEDDDGNAASQATKQARPVKPVKPSMTLDQAKDILEIAGSLQDLAAGWKQIPVEHRQALTEYKDQRKAELGGQYASG